MTHRKTTDRVNFNGLINIRPTLNIVIAISLMKQYHLLRIKLYSILTFEEMYYHIYH